MVARLLIGLIAVLAVLAGVLMMLEDGPPPGAPPVVKTDPRAETAEPGVLPEARDAHGQSSESTALLVEELSLEDDGPAAAGLLDAHGSIRGRVVDASDVPLSGIPLLLTVVHDHWVDGLDDGPLVLASTHSGVDGSFDLAARPGARHLLIAGGRRFGCVRLGDVASGDHLLVRMSGVRQLEGLVVEQGSGVPVPGAHIVTITDVETLMSVADENGLFLVTPLARDSASVVAWAPGHDVAYLPDVMVGWEPVRLELPPGRVVEGRVLDRDSDQGIAGAEVRLSLSIEETLTGERREQTGPEIVSSETAWTDDEGRFFFEGAPSTGFLLEFSADGYIPQQETRYEQRELADDEVVLAGLRSLVEMSGQVLLDTQPASGATVAIRDDGEALMFTTTDAGGLFQFGLESWDGKGRLYAEAVDADGRSARRRIKKSHRDEAILLELSEPVTVSVRVTSGGEVVPDAQVRAYGDSSVDQGSLGRTDREGLAVLTHRMPSPDDFMLRIQARHLGRQSLPVELDLSQWAPEELVELDLSAGHALTGLVTDPYGMPVEGALVWDRRAAFGHTDATGRFRLEPVALGDRCSVRVTAEGYRSGRQTVPELTGDTELFLTLEPIVSWEGRVVDSASGLPVPNFIGRLQREVVKRDGPSFGNTNHRLELLPEPGSFRVSLPEAGRFQLRIFATGYIAAMTAPIDFDGTLPPPPAEVVLRQAALLHVSVTDADGRAVPGLRLKIVDHDLFKDPKTRARAGRSGQSERTDEHGQADFNLGEGGSFRIALGAENWLEEGRLVVSPGPPVQGIYRLGATGDVALRVRDDQGDLVHRMRISLRAKGKAAAFDVSRTRRPRGDDEELHFDVLPPGSYSLTVSAKGFLSYRGSVTVVGRRATHEQVTLQAVGSSTKLTKKQVKDLRKLGGSIR
jgi:hypothetical protein